MLTLVQKEIVALANVALAESRESNDRTGDDREREEGEAQRKGDPGGSGSGTGAGAATRTVFQPAIRSVRNAATAGGVDDIQLDL